MNRDHLTALARGAFTLAIGAAVLYAVARALGWGFTLGLVIGMAAEPVRDVLSTATRLPARWRPW